MKFYYIFIALFASPLIFSQNFKKEFEKVFEVNDVKKEEKILQNWEKQNPEDPELFVSYFNHLYRKSNKNTVQLTSNNTDNQSLSIQNSKNENVAFLSESVSYDPILFQLAIDKIDEGIALFPNRLDMRFGKIYVLGQNKNWKKFTNEIINTVNYSAINKNQWTWANNESKSDGKDFLLSNIQTYQNQLYNTGDDNLLTHMQDIANTILAHYPNHIESLTNISVTHLILKEYDKGIAALLKAEKINPKDYVVLSNIAQGYQLKGEPSKAIEYYEKCIIYGDGPTRIFAKTQIETLQKK